MKTCSNQIIFIFSWILITKGLHHIEKKRKRKKISD
jgi:hypothetical protein